jgi:hypothetical protein
MMQSTFWVYARQLYGRWGGKTRDDVTLHRFVKACPPFQAMVLASTMFPYGRCIREENVPVSYRADRLDVLMAYTFLTAVSS